MKGVTVNFAVVDAVLVENREFLGDEGRSCGRVEVETEVEIP